jgi:hypothetical protein
MNAFVPGFDHDLFISYAHADDASWILSFERAVREELSRRLGVDVAVWQDEQRLRVGDQWDAEIEAAITRSAVFIAVLSPSYQNSDWCTKERGLFRRGFASPDDFERSRRFFKIVKTPWQDDSHRLFLQRIQDIAFWRREDAPPADIEFVPGAADFRRAIIELATAIAQTLRGLRRQRERVFIASPPEEVLDIWRQLREELVSQGYDVQPLGRRDEDYDDGLLRSEMDGSLLSVHLVGTSPTTFTFRQLGLAVDLEHRMVLWLTAEPDPSANPPTETDILRRGVLPDKRELPAGWMLLRDRSPRKLVNEILAALKPKPKPPVLPRNGAGSRVYLLHDATADADARVAADLRRQIAEAEDMEVMLARADLASPSELRLRHQELLQTCDGVLLYQKAAPVEWLMQTAPEVIYAERLLQREPLRSRAFLVSEPAPWMQAPNLQVIPYTSTFGLNSLEPFLAPLRTADPRAVAQ